MSKKFDYDRSVPATSRAWCSDCDFTAWGIWAAKKAKAHHRAEMHLVHFITPDTEEEKAARRAELDRIDAELESAQEQKSKLMKVRALREKKEGEKWN